MGTVERPAPDGVYVINDYAGEVLDGTLRPGDDALDAAWVDDAGFARLAEAGALTALLAETLRAWRVV